MNGNIRKVSMGSNPTWYQPGLSREEVNNILRFMSAGAFIVRDSSSYAGSYGLAMKVSHPPTRIVAKDETSLDLVRHFLIEKTKKGVRLRGCTNEPVFGSLAAFVHQHTITPLGLPDRLVLDEIEEDETLQIPATLKALEAQRSTSSVSTKVIYLLTADTESLTGPQAIVRTADLAYKQNASSGLDTVLCQARGSPDGLVITDTTRRRFFKRFYARDTIIFCDYETNDRRWGVKPERFADPGRDIFLARVFGIVNRKMAGRPENECHIFAEADENHPSEDLVEFLQSMINENVHSRMRQ